MWNHKNTYGESHINTSTNIFNFFYGTHITYSFAYFSCCQGIFLCLGFRFHLGNGYVLGVAKEIPYIIQLKCRVEDQRG